jgi:hypothetical protein
MDEDGRTTISPNANRAMSITNTIETARPDLLNVGGGLRGDPEGEGGGKDVLYGGGTLYAGGGGWPPPGV